MKNRRKKNLTRQQILDCFRWMSHGPGENVSSDKFTKHTGIPMTQVRWHFGSWKTLRSELGLNPRASCGKQYSVDDLCRHYHACVEKLGRFPSVQEFELHTGISASTFYRRVGKLPAFQQRYASWLHRQQLPDPHGHNRQVVANPPRDVVWLRNRWFNLRVGFELRSSDFKGREPDACDFLVVLEHDWPACPVRILELHQALPQGEPRPLPL